MDKEEIYSKLRQLCNLSRCGICRITSINSKHSCGHGYAYHHLHPVPLSEALKYYSIIFGVENLRTTIEKRRENDRYERRI